jgi:hypothetical protein
VITDFALMEHVIVTPDSEDLIVQSHLVHLNVLSTDNVIMVYVHADLVGQEKIVQLEHVQTHAVVMEFAEITLVNVMLVLVEMIVVNYFAQILVQIKELVIMEHAIAKILSEVQIVQLELV